MDPIYYTLGEWELSKDIMEKYANRTFKNGFTKEEFMKPYTENYEPSLIKNGRTLVLKYDYFEITIDPISKHYSICANIKAFDYVCLKKKRKRRMPVNDPETINKLFKSLFMNRFAIIDSNDDEINPIKRGCICSPEVMTYIGRITFVFGGSKLLINPPFSYSKRLIISDYVIDNIPEIVYRISSTRKDMYPFTDVLSINDLYDLENELKCRFPDYDFYPSLRDLANNIKFEREIEYNNSDFSEKDLDSIRPIISESGIASKIVTASDYIKEHYTIFKYCPVKSARN